MPSDELARLAERLPVVVVAGDPRRACCRRRHRGQPVRLGRPRAHLVEVSRQAPPLPCRRTADRARRARNAGSRSPRSFRLTLAIELVGSHCGRFSVQSGEEAGEKLLADRSALPDAVVCANDQMAIGVLQALARGGVRVPEELSRDRVRRHLPREPVRARRSRRCTSPCGCLASEPAPGCSTASPSPDLPTQVELLPTDLVLRKSCGCPPGDGSAARSGHRTSPHVSGRKHAAGPGRRSRPPPLPSAPSES